MKKKILKILSLALILTFGASFCLSGAIYAEDQTADSENSGENSSEEESTSSTSIGISPVSKVLQISSDSEYEDSFSVNNDGDNELKIEVYAAPYSYVYSEEEDLYKLGFNNENSFTQISRWVTFKDSNGEYVKKPTFTIAPNSSLDINYKISTPSNIPAGGQYAVLFAHTLTSATNTSGIRTEASPGLVVYGRSTEGETITTAEISRMSIEYGAIEPNSNSIIKASARVRNTGNVDFSASGVLKVDGVFSGEHYETATMSGRVSIIPETELVVSDEWKETPGFGIYKVTWTVNAAGETQTIEQIVAINIGPAIAILIICLTIIIVWIIISIKKRKERRSRLSV